jgi:biopolymer transport protein ExbD
MKLTKKVTVEVDFWKGTMSDIAFLLIIFFILTALFTTPYILRFTTGSESAEAVKEKELIIVEITENGTWNMNSRDIIKNELTTLLDPHKKYRIKVHDKRPYQDFIDMLNLFHAEHIYKIEIVTEE